MTTTAYAMVSLVRYRELKTRVALAAFIGFTAWFVVPSIWPPLWFAAVLATQALDWAVFRRFRHRQDYLEPWIVPGGEAVSATTRPAKLSAPVSG